MFLKVGNPLFTLFLFFLCFQLYGQELRTPTFTHYTKEDGLINIQCYYVYQDSHDYIWICTDDGIIRYDGSEFVNYTIDNGLCESTHFRAYEDLENQRVWFNGHRGNVSYYDLQTNEMVCPSYSETLANVIDGRLIQNFLVTDNKVWLNCYHAWLFELDIISGEVKEHEVYNQGISIVDVGEETEQYIFLSELDITNISLSKIDKGLKKMSIDLGKAFDSQVRTNFYGFQAKDACYFTIDKYLIYYNLKTDEYHWCELPDYATHSVTKDNEGNLWVGMRNDGVIMYPDSDLNRKPYQFLKGTSVSSIHQDREGGYWFSTLHHGVYYSKYLFVNQIEGIQGKVNELKVYKGDLYAATYQGEIFKTEFQDRKYITTKVIEETSEILDIDFLDDYIYVSSVLKTAAKYDLDDFQYHVEAQKGMYSRMQIINGEINYFTVGSTKDNEYSYHRNGESGIVRFGPVHILGKKVFMNEENRAVYIYSGNRLCFIDTNDVSSTVYDYVNDAKQLDVNFVSNYSGDTVLIGTQDRGLFLVDNDKIVRHWGTNEGLLSNTCLSFYVGDEKEIWLGTNQGLHKIIPKQANEKDEVIKFTRNHGLLSNNVTSVTMIGDSTIVGSPKGVNIFLEKEFQQKMQLPEIKKLKLHVNSSLLEWDEWAETIPLFYDENTITIDFESVYFDQPIKPFRYRLLPSNEEWIYTSNKKIHYPSLPPGTYHFELMASNSNGEWGPSKSIHFEIKLPMWKQWWFVSVVIILVMIVILGIVFVRFKQVKKELKLVNDLNVSNNKLLSAQLNPHFIFNSLNAVGYFTLRNDTNKAVGFLGAYTKLIRRVFENSNKFLVPLEEEISFLQDYLHLEQGRIPNRLSYTITVDPSVDPDFLFPPMLSQPYVENAIWHGVSGREDMGHIQIDFYMDGSKRLCCRIADNGLGFEPTSKHLKGHSGRMVSEKRILLLQEILNKKIDISTDHLDPTNHYKGTVVKINFPLISEEYD